MLAGEGGLAVGDGLVELADAAVVPARRVECLGQPDGVVQGLEQGEGMPSVFVALVTVGR
jgi:hypothetical protein